MNRLIVFVDILLTVLFAVSSVADQLKADPTGNKLKSYLEMGKKTTWISCVSEEKTQDSTMNHWNNNYKHSLSQLGGANGSVLAQKG